MAISKVGVVGGGLMGHGIAQICAQAGWDVVLREVDDAAVAEGIGRIDKQLARAVTKGRMEQADADAVRGRITETTDYGALADCDLVIEAITEDLDARSWPCGARSMRSSRTTPSWPPTRPRWR